ncbi:uncharacterized protein LAESUDRAFT_91431 [Laetiporus sulphureus 93-53]|uniref:Uncharacterized protein n=1 Tax=Laetiporus sulphureus 93-53 TaxID=1314785 RepID=A0A165EYM5_9APHY|nr:uncharacterized protein LAESUDRAFT_91431 [Laetiporus sulphureus 93-53]KZT07991.1 hypothetical protein LAESUDRAFT_91431 [Laetiporus sulphureus 93-53]
MVLADNQTPKRRIGNGWMWLRTLLADAEVCARSSPPTHLRWIARLRDGGSTRPGQQGASAKSACAGRNTSASLSEMPSNLSVPSTGMTFSQGRDPSDAIISDKIFCRRP